jgi:hypothetical protein
MARGMMTVAGGTSRLITEWHQAPAEPAAPALPDRRSVVGSTVQAA